MGMGGTGGDGLGSDGPSMIVRRAPGTANQSAAASASMLSSTTTLNSTKPPSTNPFGTVTYRHLLSAGSLTPTNPLRVIAHCDVDAAYAQFEAKRLNIDSFAVPLAVQQWQGLIAIGYKARDFGINRHCDIAKAKELCPDLQCIHVQTIAPGDAEPAYHPDPRPETHKVSLDPYRRESRKILAQFKATCPLGQVEKASIDESYFDLTVEVRKLILTRYPHLKNYPKTEKGMDEPLPAPPLIEWDGCGELMPIRQLDEDGNVVKASESGEDEEFVPSQEHQLNDQTWTDVALAHGAMLMTKVRKDVLENVGYTTSAGIASNKTLAKLCSGYRKPNNQTTLLPRAVPAFLRDLPVSKIRFLGGKLGREMGDLFEAKTVGDLWTISLDKMQSQFGPEAAWVHAVLRGVDHSPVSARIANKTMLASKNLRPFIRKRSEALGWLDTLSTELVARLREVWEDEHSASLDETGTSDATNAHERPRANRVVPTLWPKFLVLRFIRTHAEGGRSRQAPFPYVGNLSSNDVYKVAVRLWNDACDEMRLGAASTGNSSKASGSGAAVQDTMPVEVVTIALGFSGLERAEVGQKRIEGFFAASSSSHPPVTGKRKAIDEGGDGNLEPAEEGGDGESGKLRWKCEECNQSISVKIASSASFSHSFETGQEDVFDNDDPFNQLGTVAAGQTPSDDHAAHIEAQSRLDLQVQDHKDWHFAVRLSKQPYQDDEQAVAGSTRSPQKENKKAGSKKIKKGSLQSFFAKQTK